jgi:tyrosinase
MDPAPHVNGRASRVAAMSYAPRSRKSVPISEAVAVNTRQVNVAVEGLDPAGIPGSFTVHLLRDGQRIASRFMLRPSGGVDPADASAATRLAHFDFLLPIDAVADGMLTVEVEPLETISRGARVPPESIGHPTISAYLMLETR